MSVKGIARTAMKLFSPVDIASYHEVMKRLPESIQTIRVAPGAAGLWVACALLAAGCASNQEQRERDLLRSPDTLCRDSGVATQGEDALSGPRVESEVVERACLKRIAPTPRRSAHQDLTAPATRRNPMDNAWNVPMPVVSDEWPHLGLSDHGSVSVGAVASGRLFNGAMLPFLGDHHVVLHEQSLRRTNFGTLELVELLEVAAAAVANDFPGAIMTVGNISRQGGGAIPWSISHRVGRDVDIAFYLLGDDGEQVVLPNMVALAAPDATAVYEGINVHFDVARNWALLHYLLTSNKVRIQYVFVADYLLDAMFDLAQREGVSKARLDGWREIVRQPRGTLPHDDHFHVRILCSDEDVAEGCRDIFGGREQIPLHHAGFKRRAQELLEIADSSDADERRLQALARLGWMRAPGGRSLAFRLLRGDSPAAVERGALELLEEVDASPQVKVLVAFLQRSEDGPAVAAALRLLRKTSTRYARKLWPLLNQDRVLEGPENFWTRRVDLLAGAVRLQGWVGDLASGVRLVPFLEHDREEVRRAALFALRAVAAHEVFPDSVLDAPPADLPGQWRRFLRKHRDVEENFRKTLAQRGYAVKHGVGRREANQLLRALLDVDWVSLSAQRTLRRLTGKRLAVDLKDKAHVRWLWKKTVRRKWR